MQTRKFSLESVISSIHGTLLCNIGDVYDVLNFLTGDNLFTHQLPRAGRVCRIPVFKQHPFLKEIDVSDINPENWKEKLQSLKDRYPHEVELSPIENWTHIDAVEELEEMVGDKSKIIVVPKD